MVKKAVLVGINYTGTSSQLNGCINDAEHMKEMLIDQYQYAPSDIVVLRDDLKDVNLQPTRANILKEFTKLALDKTPDLSELWFFYSGHGSQIRDRSGDESDGLDEVLVPIDCDTKGPVTDDEIYNIMKNVRCKTIFLVDSCHSGSMCDLQYEITINTEGKMVQHRTKNVQRQTNNPHIISISGCSDHQTSMDTYSSRLKMHVGAFTDSFFQVLARNEYKGDILTVYQQTCELIKNTGYTQMPILSSSDKIPKYSFGVDSVPAVVTLNPKIKSWVIVEKESESQLIPRKNNYNVHIRQLINAIRQKQHRQQETRARFQINWK